MFGTFLFSTTLFGAMPYAVASTATNLIVFDGYALHDGSDNLVQKLNDDKMPVRDVDIDNIPRNNGSIIIKDFDRDKPIDMRMRISKDTNDLLEAELHTVRRKLSKKNGSLKIQKGGETIEYLATLMNGSSMIDRQHFHRTFVNLDLKFIVPDGRGRLEDYTVQSYVSETTLLFQDSVPHDGSAEAKPVYIMSFSAATGVTGIEIENVTTGEIITISEAISSGDYLQVDVENSEVTLNGSTVDFDGVFPELQAGANSIKITITGTSATYTLTIKHRKTYK